MGFATDVSTHFRYVLASLHIRAEGFRRSVGPSVHPLVMRFLTMVLSNFYVAVLVVGPTNMRMLYVKSIIFCFFIAPSVNGSYN